MFCCFSSIILTGGASDEGGLGTAGADWRGLGSAQNQPIVSTKWLSALIKRQKTARGKGTVKTEGMNVTRNKGANSEVQSARETDKGKNRKRRRK